MNTDLMCRVLWGLVELSARNDQPFCYMSGRDAVTQAAQEMMNKVKVVAQSRVFSFEEHSTIIEWAEAWRQDVERRIAQSGLTNYGGE